MISLISENIYMRFFEDRISSHVHHITEEVKEELSEKAVDDITGAFFNAVFVIVQKTMQELCAGITAGINPMAAFDPRLATAKQREDAALKLLKQLEDGTTVLPDALFEMVDERLALLENAVKEMFRNLHEHKQEISRELFDSREYSVFKDVAIGSGDYHNMARSAAVLRTDIGLLVYRPRPLLLEKAAREFVQKYFPDNILIAKCFTDGKSFGVSEFLRKKTAEGEENAKNWYRCLGELTAMASLLNSMDLHCENVISASGIPAVIDLETMVQPETGISTEGSFLSAVSASASKSALMPRELNNIQYSVLLNTDKLGSAPSVDGKQLDVYSFENDYFKGFQDGCQKIISRKAEVEKDLRSLFSKVQIRIILRDSQYYADLLTGSCRRKYLLADDPKKLRETELHNALLQGMNEEKFLAAVQAEETAILRGDIPLFYTYGDSKDLYADGEVIAEDYFEKSTVETVLEHLERMNEETVIQEEALYRRILACAAVKDESEVSHPVQKADSPLSFEQALKEAQQIMEKVFEEILTMNGYHGWIDPDATMKAASVIQPELMTGSAGIGVFAAAFASVSASESLREKAETCERAAMADIRRIIEALEKPQCEQRPVPHSAAGILRALVLMNRYHSDQRYKQLITELKEKLGWFDPQYVISTDQISGLSGLLSVLCTYEELSATPQDLELIEKLAERLLALRTFKADGHVLWKTISPRHVISGAGHGMAGIGYALYEAGKILKRDDLLSAAEDAMVYEKNIFSNKLGTWPDNRSWPASGYMHGYCSGAPGIGIMSLRMDLPECAEIREMAEKSIDTLPLLYRDHLCCGNSSLAEFYISAGEREKAGKILNSMYLRKEETGHYRLMSGGYRNIEILSLFYGITGIGYEMLRYADPDAILPVF